MEMHKPSFDSKKILNKLLEIDHELKLFAEGCIDTEFEASFMHIHHMLAPVIKDIKCSIPERNSMI